MTSWVYEVHVVGQLSDDVLAQIQADRGEVVATTLPASTLIRGQVPDQSALMGMLDQLHALGLNVSEVRRAVDLDEMSDVDHLPRPVSTRYENRPE
jgi:hypothetical protein